MIVYLHEKYVAKQRTGKGRFAARLVEAFPRHGVKVVTNPNKAAEIGLHIGRCYYMSDKVKKNVLRVGPASIDTNMDYKKINREKAKSVKMVDGIIYQSEYSRKAYHTFVCKPKIPETVIFNGANPKDYEVEPYESNFSVNFLASTRVWLKQKRLKDIIKSFLMADVPDACLLVNGDTQGVEKKYQNCDNIMFFGPVSDKVLARMYRLVAMAGAYIHIVYVDACPNSVVEAIVARCPIINNNSCGTAELWNGGWDLDKKPFDFKPTNLQKPSKIYRNELARIIKFTAMGPPDRIFPNKMSEILRKRLCIDTIAQQYVEFFEMVLNN